MAINRSGIIGHRRIIQRKIELKQCVGCLKQVQSSSQGMRSTERILRYPDGHERRIRYPIVEGEDQKLHTQSSGFTTKDFFRTAHYVQQETHDAITKESSAIPDTPFQLFQTLNSKETRKERSIRLNKVRNSYNIWDGCPWVLPKPIYVLTKVDESRGGIGQMYTIRVRQQRTDNTNELAQLFRNSSSAQFIEVSQMKDGVLLFEDLEQAELYADMLEEEALTRVLITEVDSHELFKMVTSVKAVVIGLKVDSFVPHPYELVSSLKRNKSVDEAN
eukprot:TRINITY_DN4179_c0_g1_i3.p2 TRINITY_DN4179_c0_g1~~TRINITY_DN4179_c0_g1_i3.p2  ORF type:complete len:275 (-),score=32.68 TRINITY_DN4179_c0_g1_i3:303-1127(-)